MVFVHIGTHIPVIPVAQDGKIVKKDIRSLQSQLVKPAVFGDDIFKLVVGHIIVCFRTKNIMSGKARHKIPLFVFVLFDALLFFIISRRKRNCEEKDLEKCEVKV